MNMISRIALKIARQYLADEQNSPYSYEQLDDLQIEETDVIPLINECVNSSSYKSQKAYYNSYDLSSLIQSLSKKLAIQVDITHYVSIFYLPKNFNQFMPSQINTQIKTQINYFCNNNGLGMTSSDGKRIYIGTTITTQNGEQFIVDDFHLRKTLRHQLQHSCSKKFNAQTDKIQNTIENDDSEKMIMEFASREQIGRYKNDMISDIKRFKINPQLFISFVQKHKLQNGTQILAAAEKQSIQYMQKNRTIGLLNTDIGNSMIFMYAIYKYNRSYYRRVISCLQQLKQEG